MKAGAARIRINVFPGVQNLPNFAAERMGFFANRGLDLETVFTTSSQEQRDALAEGACDIAHSAVDNALALADSGVGVSIVFGLDQGFNKLVTRPELASYDALKGKILGVDAPDTAFALLSYEALLRKGLARDVHYEVRTIGATRFRLEALERGDIHFTMLNLPFNLLAQTVGMKILDDPLNSVGPYQATGGFVRREWAQRHRDELTRYIAGYIEGERWVLDPANRAEAAALLRERMNLSPEVLENCYEQVSLPNRGFSRDARIDPEGMETVLRLRDGFSPRSDGRPRRREEYVDETFRRDALTLV